LQNLADIDNIFADIRGGKWASLVLSEDQKTEIRNRVKSFKSMIPTEKEKFMDNDGYSKVVVNHTSPMALWGWRK